MHNHDELLKTDVLGRVRTSRQRREALLEEFSKSGVSASKFAQMAGVNYQTFATWVQKQGRRQAAETDSSARPLQWSLVEALPIDEGRQLKEEVSCASLVVHLSVDVRLEVASAAQIELAVQFIKTLQRIPC